MVPHRRTIKVEGKVAPNLLQVGDIITNPDGRVWMLICSSSFEPFIGARRIYQWVSLLNGHTSRWAYTRYDGYEEYLSDVRIPDGWAFVPRDSKITINV